MKKKNARAGIKGIMQGYPTGNRTLGGYQPERM